jgi:hypothetical protein
VDFSLCNKYEYKLIVVQSNTTYNVYLLNWLRFSFSFLFWWMALIIISVAVGLLCMLNEML